MKIVNSVIRILVGLMLVVFGANKFFNFIPMEPATPQLGAFMMALVSAGYIMPMVAVVEILIGVSFLVNRYVALSLVLLAPLSVNFVGINLAFTPEGVAPALFVFIANVYLIVINREKYLPMLK